jgi:hypothetical protein
MKLSRDFMVKTVCALFVSSCLAFVFAFYAEAALPNSPFAVLANGPSVQHNKSAEAIVNRQLLAKGYKVVAPKQWDAIQNAIRNDKIARLALQGDVESILKLSRAQKATMIVIQVEADNPRMNEFKLYTGTASLAVTVGAPNGTIIYADTTMGKEVGYTSGEALQKAIETASKRAVNGMTE